MTDKTIAAILNLLIWGIGYLYLGKRKPLGIGLFIGYIFVHLPLYFLGLNWGLTVPGIYQFIGHIIISLTLAYDAYKLNE